MPLQANHVTRGHTIARADVSEPKMVYCMYSERSCAKQGSRGEAPWWAQRRGLVRSVHPLEATAGRPRHTRPRQRGFRRIRASDGQSRVKQVHGERN